METDERLDLERRLHALVCGDTDERERAALLARLAHDETARDVLAEMLRVQRGARAALGYERAEAALAGSMAEVVAEVSRPSAPAAPGRRNRGRPWAVWGLAAAAVVTLAAGAWMAATAVRTQQRIEQRLARLEQAVTLPSLTEEELASFRTLWRHVAGTLPQEAPWILLAGGGGRFGYVPATAGGEAEASPLLVRCRLVGCDGEVHGTFNVLVPAAIRSPLVLDGVASLHHRPVACEIATRGGEAVVRVTVGGEEAGAAGVQGRVAAGQGPVEVGQFRINGCRVQVVCQALPLGGVLG